MALKKYTQAVFCSLLIFVGSFLSASAYAVTIYNSFNIQLSTLEGNTHNFTYNITPKNNSLLSSGLPQSSIDNLAKVISVAGDAANPNILVADLTIFDDAKLIYAATIQYNKSAGSIVPSITNMNLSNTYFSSKTTQPTEISAPSVQITLRASN